MDPEFKKFLEASGMNPEDMDEEQIKAMQKAWKASIEASQPQPEPKPEPKKPEPNLDDPKVISASAVKAERERAASINAACDGFEGYSEATVAKVEEIRAAALGDGTDASDVNAKLIELVRAERADVHVNVGGGDDVNLQTLEASVCLGQGLPEKELLANYGEKVLTAAAPLRGIGLRELMAHIAMLEGISLPRASQRSNEWIRAAFSTVGLSGILGNTANTTLLAAYNAVPSVADKIAAKGTVSDFKEHTRYRLGGNMNFEKVGPDGELKHGTVSEQSFTQQIDTWGRMFMLTRQDVINDDLGAFLAIPKQIGRGAANSKEKEFFKLLLSNPSSFFATSHTGGAANLIEGTAYALSGTDSVAAIAAVVDMFLNQTDPNGDPINVEPKFLLVPPALKAYADELYKSTNLVTGASTKVRQPSTNVHAGKYEPLVSPYLSNSNLTGYSTTGYYLFADPNDLPAFEIAYLNGVDTPTVEEIEPPANVLGKGFRGYMDFGIKEQDFRGAVLATGVASE